MGILTDPSNKDGLVKHVLIHHHKFSILFYLSGILWFMAIAYHSFNAETYFSENALLPGLVERDFTLQRDCESFYSDFKFESYQGNSSAAFTWLFSRFTRLGLDVYLQNFSFRPVFSSNKVRGRNLYAILRAPRAASTEALVLSTPYRYADESGRTNTLPSIALMFCMAKFFSGNTYWAKDIIFLIAEHELVGFQAWLDAYHETKISSEVIETEDIIARSGSIQAAINLEIYSDRISGLNLKVEGLNGQLPNLDLVNLVVELCRREYVPVKFQRKSDPKDDESFEGWKHSIATLASMMITQATGSPSAAHGLFHRYGIHSVTLQSYSRSKQKDGIRFVMFGRIIEGVFRSLNNLLEKFHQSFFFYVLPSTSRYISIGMYMPPFSLIVLPLLLKASSLWLLASRKSEDQNDAAESSKPDTSEDVEVDYSLSSVVPIYFFVHLLGIGLAMAPKKLVEMGRSWNFTYEQAIFYGMLSAFCSLLTYPLFLRRRIRGHRSWEVLKCVTLLELSTVLFALSMMNFSLSFMLSVIYTPVCYFISPSPSRCTRILKSIFLLLISPLVLLYLILVTYSCLNLADDGVTTSNVFSSSLNMEMSLLVKSIEDGYTYGNWLFRVVCCFVCPTWLLLWGLLYGCYAYEPLPPSDHPSELDEKKDV